MNTPAWLTQCNISWSLCRLGKLFTTPPKWPRTLRKPSWSNTTTTPAHVTTSYKFGLEDTQLPSTVPPPPIWNKLGWRAVWINLGWRAGLKNYKARKGIYFRGSPNCDQNGEVNSASEKFLLFLKSHFHHPSTTFVLYAKYFIKTLFQLYLSSVTIWVNSLWLCSLSSHLSLRQISHSAHSVRLE